MPIPVLSDKQMGDLRGMLNQRKVIDLTGNQNAKATRLPQMPEEGEQKATQAQDLNVAVDGGTATVTLTGSTSAVKFKGLGTVQIQSVRRNATPEEMAEWGDRPDGTPKNAGWRGIIPLENGDVMTEVTIGVEIDGVETDIPLIVPSTTNDDLEVIAQLAMGNIGVQDIPSEIEDRAITWAEYRISENLSPYYNGDAEDEQWREIDDSVLIDSPNPELSASVSPSGVASIALSGTTSTVDLVGTGDVTIRGNTNGQIEIDCAGGTVTGMPFPDWLNLVGYTIILSGWSQHSDFEFEYDVHQDSWLYVMCYFGFHTKADDGYEGEIRFSIDADSADIFKWEKEINTYSMELRIMETKTDLIPVKAGTTLQISYHPYGAVDDFSTLRLVLYH